MPVGANSPGGRGFDPPTNEELIEDLLNFFGLDEASRDELAKFLIKKSAEIPIEALVQAVTEVARGIKKAPGFIIGENVIAGTAGAGEEEAIALMQERERIIRAIEEAIRIALLASRGRGVAMQLVMRDP